MEERKPWMEFHVVEEDGYHSFRHGSGLKQACVLANELWRESGTDVVELVRDGEPFDAGTVTTTGRIRHFTGLAKVVPEPGARYPSDMWGPFLARLCADWLRVGDVLRVCYDPSLFLARREALEAAAFLK